MKREFVLLAMCIAIISCKKEDDPSATVIPVGKTFDNGAYVVNEGSMGDNNASISHIGVDGETTNDLYLSVNGVELGDVAQSFTVVDDKGYAVLNNSQRVEVIGLADFKHVTTIDGLSYPRYIVAGADQHVYLSDGSMQGYVHVIDTQTNSITASVSVGNGPDKMLLSGSNLFVCNSGGYLTDNRVSVLDLNTHDLLTHVAVGDRPTDLVSDMNGNIWVLCAGETIYDANWSVIGHTNAMLYKIDAITYNVISSAQIGENGDHPMNLEISPDGTTMYYENNGIYAFNINTGELPGTLIISGDRGSLNVDPDNGDIWSASVSDWTNPSVMSQYAADGTLLRTYQVGIGANAVVFH